MTEINQAKKTSSLPQYQLNRVDALLLPIGMNQVGWRCRDGIVRSLGTNLHHESDWETVLYRELGIDPVSDWELKNGDVGTWGERFYKHCTDTLGGDFSAVELLADTSLLQDCLQCGLKRLILWALDAQDTLWIAWLMWGKVRQLWHQLVEVNVLSPMETLGNSEVDRLGYLLETKILPFALQDLISSDDPDRFVLAIRTLDADEVFSCALERCTPSLVRQCRVLRLSPLSTISTPDTTELPIPTPASYEISVVSNQSWLLDRPRTIAIWQRGWFQDAATRLAVHPHYCGEVLSELARRLTLLNRGEINRFVHDRDFGIESWLQLPYLPQFVEPERLESWHTQLSYLRNHPYAEAWEAIFSMERLLQQDNYTRGFLHFAQILEQLLYLQYQSQDWLAQGLVPALERPKSTKNTNTYQPGIKQLISAWCKSTRQAPQSSIYRLFDGIGNTRNAILHYGGVIPFDDLLLVWSTAGLPVAFTRPQYLGLMARMKETLSMACDRTWNIPQPTLGQTLSDWGVQWLANDEG